VCAEALGAVHGAKASLKGLQGATDNNFEPTDITGPVGAAFQKQKMARLALVHSLNEYIIQLENLENALGVCAYSKGF
jgi:hypothetical protein